MFIEVDEQGYYGGKLGGAYIPEMLHPNIEELRDNYLSIISEPAFVAEFQKLLKDYVGTDLPQAGRSLPHWCA